jgi:hypothetical protein
MQEILHPPTGAAFRIAQFGYLQNSRFPHQKTGCRWPVAFIRLAAHLLFYSWSVIQFDLILRRVARPQGNGGADGDCEAVLEQFAQAGVDVDALGCPPAGRGREIVTSSRQWTRSKIRATLCALYAAGHPLPD